MTRKTLNGTALTILVLSVSIFALGIHKAVAVENIYDLNGDGKVDIADVAMASAAFGAASGDPKYDSKADLNSDGKVDLVDLGSIAHHFGETSL